MAEPVGAFCDSPLYQQLKAMTGHVVEVHRPSWDRRIVGVLRHVMPPTTGGRPPMLQLDGHEAGYLVEVDTSVVDLDRAAAIREQDQIGARVTKLERERNDARSWCDRALGDLRELLDAFDGPGGTQEHALYVVRKARTTLRAWDAFELIAGVPDLRPRDENW